MDSSDALANLLTVRDWLRFATSRFSAAGLEHSQGTTSALDEAAFLILASLDLPIEDVNPWADARLTMAERVLLLKRITARIERRTPSAYLVGAAWIGPYRFKSDPRAIVPRSFLGELMLAGALDAWIPDRAAPARILDLCTGSGCLAIVAAHLYPHAVVDAVELSPEAFALAQENVALHGLEERVRLHLGDLWAPLPRGAVYDLILSNPPYVDADAMAALSPEHQAEPAMALDGGADGMDLVRRILDDAPRYLAAGAPLVVEIGEGQEALLQSRPDLPYVWLDTELSQGEVFLLEAPWDPQR